MTDDEAKLIKAAQCRRLARNTWDRRAITELEGFAAELEAEVEKARRPAVEPKPVSLI